MIDTSRKPQLDIMRSRDETPAPMLCVWPTRMAEQVLATNHQASSDWIEVSDTIMAQRSDPAPSDQRPAFSCRLPLLMPCHARCMNGHRPGCSRKATSYGMGQLAEGNRQVIKSIRCATW